ncbi:MAG: hypothetical protein MJ175_10235 [Clostridia bacterium]|nr:hypothetical protein [Clostridia bacterium]
MPISFALCPISPLDDIPMGDTTLKYIHTEISPENYGKFDTICSSSMHDPVLPYSQYAGNKDFCLTRADGELPELLFSAVTVSSTKPCAYKTTETLDFMVKLLKQEFGKHGINVSDPILLAKETYKSKFSENCETCKRSFTDLCCGGCSHKTGFSNKYSDYICDHGIYVNLSKKLEFQQ